MCVFFFTMWRECVCVHVCVCVVMVVVRKAGIACPGLAEEGQGLPLPRGLRAARANPPRVSLALGKMKSSGGAERFCRNVSTETS